MDEALYNLVILKIADNMHSFLRKNKETVSFTVSYLAQISIQHWLYAVLVFGRDTINTREKYLKTLKATYAT